MAGQVGGCRHRMDTKGWHDTHGDRCHHVGRSRADERGCRARRDPHAAVGDAREAPVVKGRGAPLVTESAPATTTPPTRASNTLGRALFLTITAACFLFLYFRLNGAAAREGLPLVDYMTRVFANVRWLPWLLLMMVYSCFYFTIDTLVVTRALNWFIKPIRYRDILPIRASAYIISLFSEQIGKGAMAYYLNRRDNVPGWEVGSVMLFIMFGEVFYLMAWGVIGYVFGGSTLPEVFRLIPWIGLGGGVVLTVWILYFKGAILPNNGLRNQRIFHA